MGHAAYKEASTPHSKGKRVHHLEVHMGEDGGHRVVHHYHDDGLSYHPPKEHYFGKDEGHETMAHIAKHGKIAYDGGEEEES